MKIKSTIRIYWISVENEISLKQLLFGFKMPWMAGNRKFRVGICLNFFLIIAHLRAKNKKISAGFLVEEGDFYIHRLNISDNYSPSRVNQTQTL